MRFSKTFNRQARYSMAAFAAVIALVVSALAPTFVSAAQLTERSIALSNSSKGATNVTYTVNFTASAAAGAFIIQFCSNSPLIGQTCDTPAGFDSSAATSADATAVAAVASATNEEVVTDSIAAGNVSVALAGITNPTAAGPLYARIVTYDTASHATSNYPSIDSTDGAVDNGGAAVSITDSVGVSGLVMETMTFCVSGGATGAPTTDPLTKDCGGVTSPALVLGQTTGDVTALSSSAVSTGNIYTQISTNALSGAVVNLKSDATDCGGLVRAGAASNAAGCGIIPVPTASDISAGDNYFGVKLGTAAAASDATNPNGTFQAANGSAYNTLTYTLGYKSDNTTGVTSPYGDAFLDTSNAPINNMNMPLTFGASVSNSTPAGSYSANLSLVATGKF